jgi:ketosteroid isomerase-like protein
MPEHPNATLARGLVAAFTRGDLATVAEYFAPDAVWELPGTSPVTGTYTGPEQIVGFLAKAYEMSGGTLALDVIDVLGSDWGAVQVQRVTAAAGDRGLDCVETLAHKIIDGRIVQTYHRPDQYAIDSFFG